MPWWKPRLLPWAGLTWCLVAPAAAAPPAIDVQHFQPSGDPSGWATVRSPRPLPLWQPSFGLWFNYSREPLVYWVSEPEDGWDTGARTEYRLVGDLVTADIQAAVGFGVADLALDIPVHLAVRSDYIGEWTASSAAPAMGDLRLTPKVQVIDADARGWGLGMALPVTFPVTTKERYLGMRTVSASPIVLFGAKLGAVRLGVNLGCRLTAAEEVGTDSWGTALLFRAAASVPLHARLQLGLELYGDAGESLRTSPLEWLLVATVRPVESVQIYLAVGTGIGPGIGAPQGRLALGARFMPDLRRDSDGDGVTNRQDACDDDAEDADGFEDADGCPDPDNDEDKVVDGSDGCPDEPENHNGYQDGDGCPDPELVELDMANHVIRVRRPLEFLPDKVLLAEDSQEVLAALATLMQQHPEILRMGIRVFSDEKGTPELNQKFCASRATMVLHELTERGISADRLVAVGRGEPATRGAGDAPVGTIMEFVIVECETRTAP